YQRYNWTKFIYSECKVGPDSAGTSRVHKAARKQPSATRWATPTGCQMHELPEVQRGSKFMFTNASTLLVVLKTSTNH
ncbi:hypothetical protein FRC12_008891, partial [Ceratobasidium sp. 428]